MDIYTDEAELTDIRMVQRVVDMFDGHPCLQSIVTYSLSGLEYDYGPDDRGEDRYGSWARDHRNYNEYPRLADRGLGGNHSRLTRSQPRLNYHVPVRDLTCQPDVKEEEKESDTERKARLLQESKKSTEKAKKKQLKKQKQKERKRREKLEKEKQNPVKDEQRKDDAEESTAANDQYKDSSSSSGKLQGAAKHADTSSDSSDEDSDSNNDSDDLEELDMTSTFVSKAALIAKRQLEQKPKSERKERKKIPDKEHKTAPEKKPNEDQEVEKKDSAATNSLTFEDNVKISTDFAIIGNKFASTGDFNMAVKYFTDAIKYNPTEFKLFGNRSFCFEKLQEYDKALTDAELSLGICPGWVKGLFRKGRALAGLKRYEEAAQAFRDVLKLESSYAEASQELMRVQITQLMEYGYTREQSSNALIIHGTVEKALEVLSKLNCRPGAIQNSTLQHVSGVSPVLSANTKHAPLPAAAAVRHPPPPSQDAVIKTPFNKPLGPVQNTTNVQSQPKPGYALPMKSNNGDNRPLPELFPVWVGNLNHPVSELVITKLFTTVGVVHSVKLLTNKRCAFVNFTKQVCCDEAIRNLHGVDLNGNKIAVRYPDRIPPGMGISRSALRADDLQDENVRHSEYVDGRNPAGNRRFVRPHRPASDYRGNH